MSIRSFISIAFAIAWVPAVTTSAEPPPNVLMICVDDLKPTLGCYGDSYAVTPNIDSLANRGIRFDRAYCNQAVCSPSRNSLMTGLRPQSIGVYDLFTFFRKAAPNAITMTQHFKQHGYHSAGVGKIYHVGHGNTDDKASWSEPWTRPNAPGYVAEESLANIVKDSRGKKRGPATESADVPDDTYRDGKVAARAIDRLRAFSQKPDQPFFYAVGMAKPHLPFVAPKKYWDLYDPSKVPMPRFTQRPAGAPDYAKTNYGELRNYSDIPKKEKLSQATVRQLIHGYYAATSYMDAQVGKILKELDTLDLTKNTIVLLWGDHGWHLGDHGFWCKHTNYEQAARIPVVIADPRFQQGTDTNALIETVDLYPTLTELAGLPKPAKLDGQSFAGLIRGDTTQARSFATHVYPRGGRMGRAIRTDRYRLVQWKDWKIAEQAAEYELYDYKNDPLETKNIAEKHPDLVSQLESLIADRPIPKPQWKPKK